MIVRIDATSPINPTKPIFETLFFVSIYSPSAIMFYLLQRFSTGNADRRSEKCVSGRNGFYGVGKSGGAGGGKKQKTRRGEWISSSRLGAYLGVLSEHKEPSPVFRVEAEKEQKSKALGMDWLLAPWCLFLCFVRTQGTVPCVQGAGKMIPRALVVGFNLAFHLWARSRLLFHTLFLALRL